MAFSHKAMEILHNADLADSLGNLFSRAVAMCKRYCNGVIPSVECEGAFDVASTIQNAEGHEKYELNKMTEAYIAAVHLVNKYLTDSEPWKIKTMKPSVRRSSGQFLNPATTLHFFPNVREATGKMFKTMNVDSSNLRNVPWVRQLGPW